MKTKDGFIQAYNAQAAVDARPRSSSPTGSTRSRAININWRRWPTRSKPIWARSRRSYRLTPAIAPTPTCGAGEREIDGYIAPGRAKHAGEGEGGGARVAAMREKIKAGGHASPYRLRKQLPEPVFGQIKQARGFRQFLLRGVEKVAAEWGLVCLAHNVLKLAQGRTPSSAALATG